MRPTLLRKRALHGPRALPAATAGLKETFAEEADGSFARVRPPLQTHSVASPTALRLCTNQKKHTLRRAIVRVSERRAPPAPPQAVGGPLAFEDLYVSGILEVAAAVDPEADGSSAPQGAVAAAAPRGAAGPASSALVAVGAGPCSQRRAAAQNERAPASGSLGFRFL